ncbi:MAG: RnfABCDGE type electron transport complex subunit G [Ruminococcaceae bacterium]|nr:RnfABCDGE type electron transport complex subunit G [Oscillospiraceae bacterium]
MKKFTFKSVGIPTIVLFLIAAICTAILAVTNNVTAPKIADNNAKAEIEARKRVFTQAADFSDVKEINGSTYVEALDEKGNLIGYVFTTSSKGYGGEIKVMTGIDKDGKVTGMDILSIAETAGLGMNAKKDEFKNQYKDNTGIFTVVKNGAGENEIQALTGATITSQAVTDAVNIAVDCFNTLTGGDK